MPIENLFFAKQDVQIDKGPLTRPAYLKKLSVRDGLSGIQESKQTAYCALSLTLTPDELKPILKERQTKLMNILKEAGLTAYDPGSAPLSPDSGLTIGPEEIYRVDKGKVVGARFFVSLDLLPSTGVGVEEETARTYNRIAVILHDKAIRTSRMQPNRIIHLQYDDLDLQRGQLIEVFRFLQRFEPGIGFENGVPVLLGFQRNHAVNLEKETYKTFPDLKYEYDGSKPIVKLKAVNPDVFV